MNCRNSLLWMSLSSFWTFRNPCDNRTYKSEKLIVCRVFVQAMINVREVKKFVEEPCEIVASTLHWIFKRCLFICTIFPDIWPFLEYYPYFYFLIIPAPDTLLCRQNLVISNNTSSWRPYEKIIHAGLIWGNCISVARKKHT